MISYCVDIYYEDIYRSLPTIFGDFEFSHYEGGYTVSNTRLYSGVHPELQFIAIF